MARFRKLVIFPIRSIAKGIFELTQQGILTGKNLTLQQICQLVVIALLSQVANQ